MSEQAPDSIGIIDIAPFLTGAGDAKAAVARAVDAACRDTGFLVVTGHGVPAAVIAGAFGEFHAFFDSPVDEKEQARSPHGDNLRGYVGIEENALSYSMDADTPPDLFERYTCGLPGVPGDAFHNARGDTLFQPNIWPPARPRMGVAISDYFRAMEKLTADLLCVCAVALGLDEHFFADKIDHHSPLLSANFYPEQLTAPEPGQLRAGTHTDYGSLTILATEDKPGGLQVKSKRGEWIDVHPVAGSFIINLGDLMARWTNDRWVSTLHRVVNPPVSAGADSRRLSLVFFHHPNEDALIECIPTCASADAPAKYPPITAGDHIMEKFAKQRADSG
jgi:isopenicillin N synthase-like dioxygenase